jgi:cation:H+ antiporter
VISPPRVDPSLIRREVPALLLATAAIPLVLLDGRVSRAEGLAMLCCAMAFTALMLKTARAIPAQSPLGVEARAEEEAKSPTGSRLGMGLLSAIGLAMLLGGGKLFVDGAVGVALLLGMSERMVGLTIVAVGTSLPELAASVTAARRAHSSIAIGNVVGSNIFNALLILGGAAAVAPIHGSISAMRLDLASLGVLTVVGAWFLSGDRTLSRLEGGALVGCYGGFVALLALG